VIKQHADGTKAVAGSWVVEDVAIPISGHNTEKVKVFVACWVGVSGEAPGVSADSGLQEQYPCATGCEGSEGFDRGATSYNEVSR
jgi:hypothetical protein